MAQSDSISKLAWSIRQSPEFFAREICGFTPIPLQRDVLNALRDHPAVAVKTGHSFGKDGVAAVAALWFHVAYRPSVVVTTAPTQRQVKNVIWAEIASLYRQAEMRGGGEWGIGGTLQTEALRSGDSKHYMIGYTADDPGGFTGFHSGTAILVVVSEAQAVEPRMWPAIRSLLTAPVSKLLIVGNAYYQPESEFYAAFTSKRHQFATFTGSSEDSPYCSKEWVAKEAEDWGRDSPMFRARVGGEFAPDVVDAFIPLVWIAAAQARWTEEPPAGVDPADTALGGDVSRGGPDSTEFYERRGIWFRNVYSKHGNPTDATAGEVRRLATEKKIATMNVRIDVGGLGAGVVDPLRGAGFLVTPVHFSSASSRQDRFLNIRAEMYWTLRERFRTGVIAIDPRDTRLAGELSVIRLKANSVRGLIQIEEKDEIRRRLGRSPDRADALALASMQGEAMETVLSRRVLFEFAESKQIVSLDLIDPTRPRMASVHREQGRFWCSWLYVSHDGVLHVYDEASYLGLDEESVIVRLKSRVLGSRHSTGTPGSSACPSTAKDFTWIVNSTGERISMSSRVGPIPRSSSFEAFQDAGMQCVHADQRMNRAADDLVAMCRDKKPNGAGFRVDPRCTDTIEALRSMSRDGDTLECDGMAKTILYAVRFALEFRRMLERDAGYLGRGVRRVRNYAIGDKEST